MFNVLARVTEGMGSGMGVVTKWVVACDADSCDVRSGPFDTEYDATENAKYGDEWHQRWTCDDSISGDVLFTYCDAHSVVTP